MFCVVFGCTVALCCIMLRCSLVPMNASNTHHSRCVLAMDHHCACHPSCSFSLSSSFDPLMIYPRPLDKHLCWVWEQETFSISSRLWRFTYDTLVFTDCCLIMAIDTAILALMCLAGFLLRCLDIFINVCYLLMNLLFFFSSFPCFLSLFLFYTQVGHPILGSQSSKGYGALFGLSTFPCGHVLPWIVISVFSWLIDDDGQRPHPHLLSHHLKKWWGGG